MRVFWANLGKFRKKICCTPKQLPMTLFNQPWCDLFAKLPTDTMLVMVRTSWNLFG